MSRREYASYPGAGEGAITSGDVTVTGGVSNVTAISGASPILITPNVLEWIAAASAPTLTQATPTTDVATVPLTITSQAPWASAVTNVVGGSLNLNIPAPISGGTIGTFNWQSGGVTRLSYALPNTGGTNTGALTATGQLSIITSTANAAISLVANGSGTPSIGLLSTTVNAAAPTFNWQTGGQVTTASFTSSLTAPTLSFASAASSPAFTQAALASTSAGAGAAGQPLAVTAQAGQAATGAGNNGGAGGVLALSGGAGGTSGSATAGAAGLVGFGSSIGGLGTAPLRFTGQTSPNTVACGTGGTQTISAAQAIIPFFLVTTGTLSSPAIVDFGTNAVTGYFLVDISGVGTITGQTLGFKNGTKTITFNATQLAAFQATGLTMITVVTSGTNNISIG